MLMLIWDFLLALLVVFPIVTGGLWFQRPGFHLEYTQPGFAALILALLLYGFAKKTGRSPLRECRLLYLGEAAGRWWVNRLASKPLTTLLGAWGFMALLWFLTSFFRHRALSSGLADLGIFTNGIWNLSQQGFPFSSLKEGQSLLADHQIFLLYPLGWIFPLWPSPIFLLLLQAFALTSGGIALFLLARQRLGKHHYVVPWLPFLFWLSGPLRAVNRFDFHPEVFMLPLFLFSVFLLQESGAIKRVAGLLLFLLALAAKESAGPVACGIGLTWLLGSGPLPTRAFTRVMGGIAVVLGVAIFLFDSSIVPGWFATKYAYGDLYEPFGSSLGSLASAPFLYPSEFFGRLLSVSRLKFLGGLFLPFAFLPVLAPRALLAALPGLLMLFLTKGDHRISLAFHYSIEPMVGVLLALPGALAHSAVSRWKPFVLPFLLVCCLLSFGRSEVFFWRIYQPTSHQTWLRNEVLPRISGDKSVSASYGLVPHLAIRRWVNQIPYFEDDRKAPVDCALIDSAVNNTPLSQDDLLKAEVALTVHHYQREFSCGSFSLYRREGGASCFAGSAPSCGEP